MRRKKGVAVQKEKKKEAYHISGRYNETEEEARLRKVYVLGSCPLPRYSIDFPLVVLVQLPCITS